jgi:putative effector of murein hydrolase LrgA (UPF0299 family)
MPGMGYATFRPPRITTSIALLACYHDFILVTANLPLPNPTYNLLILLLHLHLAVHKRSPIIPTLTVLI